MVSKRRIKKSRNHQITYIVFVTILLLIYLIAFIFVAINICLQQKNETGVVCGAPQNTNSESGDEAEDKPEQIISGADEVSENSAAKEKQPESKAPERTPQKQNTTAGVDEKTKRISLAANLNPSIVSGYWKLEGSRYAYLRFSQNKWSSSFMTLSNNKFITYEDDGWLGNVIQCSSQGIGLGGKKVVMRGSVMNDTTIGAFFNKQDANSSFIHLAENYGFEFMPGPTTSDNRLIFNLGGKKYTFKREDTSGCVMFDAQTKLLEYTPYVTTGNWKELKIDVNPGSVEYVTVKKDSLPSSIRQYAAYTAPYFTVEYVGTDEKGNYRFKITASKDARGISSFGFPNLWIYIDN